MPTEGGPPRIAGAECLLPGGRDLDSTVRFFVDELGFRVDAIAPADDPVLVRLSGHGLRLALDRAHNGDPGTLRLMMAGTESRAPVTAPNGVRVEFASADPPLEIPPAAPQASIRPAETSGSEWTRGRAGMLYRDLMPDRAGGYVIASHIRIPEGGPVPDHVHYHDIRFQFIYCYRGWVRLVYEDQGEPFVMHAGDCVLQPPRIRHRVLAASPGLEVIEVTCPARHMTYLEHEMKLPTGRRLPDRDYGGQRFVFHEAGNARWTAPPEDDFEARDLGLETATRGLVRARVLRLGKDRATTPDACAIQGGRAFVFLVVLKGSAAASLETIATAKLEPGGTCLVPDRSRASLRRCSPDLEILEVRCPS